MDSSMLFQVSGWIFSIIALTISVLSFGINLSIKRFELRKTVRSDILGWHHNTLPIIYEMAENCTSGKRSSEIRHELLKRLSIQVELGRFLFPNEIKGTNHGREKPAAYQGLRHIVLDILMETHRTFGSRERDPNRIMNLGRAFTSYVFIVADPRSFSRSVFMNTKVDLYPQLSAEEFDKIANV